MTGWLEQGLKHIWLPYTQMQDFPEPLPVKTAKGSYIHLEDGRKLIDGIASWWSMAHGYNDRSLIRATSAQLRKLPHVMLAGLANKPAYNLASELINFINPRKKDYFSHVFFSDSGSTAVEVALKMSVQYHLNLGNSNKCKFISFKNSYHGDTMGGMSMADLESSMHAKFKKFLPKQFNYKLPENERELKQFYSFVKQNHHNVAAIIIEPLLQCAGGVKFHDAEILEEIMEIARDFGLLTIFDECATGFYRTGEKFAFYHLKDKAPDILCIGKALTGGMLTLAATVTNPKIFNSFLDDSLDKALMHGPTFMGNPTACSAALASLKLFERRNYKSKVKKINKIMQKSLKLCANYNRVIEVRTLGAIAVVELDKLSWQETLWLRQEFVNEGIWLRPFANVIYVMPPLTIKENELMKIFIAIKKVLDKFETLNLSN